MAPQRTVVALALTLVACSTPYVPGLDAARDAHDAASEPVTDARPDVVQDVVRDDIAPMRLSVRLVAPADGATVSGTVTLVADVANAVGTARVEFDVDGVALATVASAPYQTAWDTATAHANPLPAATHPIDFGYYFVESKYGDFRAEVNGYTNEFYALAFAASPSGTPWGGDFSVALQHAADEQRVIHLNAADPMYYDEALDRAAPFWDRVTRVELSDEPAWTQSETEAVIADARGRIASRGLAPRPLGVVYTRTQVLTGDGVFSAGLDWVGIEAYVDPPGSSVAADNAAALADFVGQAKARIPPDKSLVIVMQAYDRNGQWTDIATLAALQSATYQLAFDDPRVVAINMFAYGRPGGTHDHPELAVEHRRIAERLFGRTIGSLSNGPHTLVARAMDGAGNMTASATLTVNVANAD